jgi:hypothetical protein
MGIWSPVNSKEKRERWAFVGAGGFAVLTIIGTVVAYFYPPKPSPPNGASSIASASGVAIGGNVSGSSITVVAPTGEDRTKIKDDVIKQFRDTLHSLNEVQMQKGETFDPHLATYIHNPNENNWKVVQADANKLLDKINSVMTLARSYDAQFVVHRERIIILSGQGKELVNRGYTREFGDTRDALQERGAILGAIMDKKTPPTVGEAREWVRELRVIYRRLSGEMDRLLDILERDI